MNIWNILGGIFLIFSGACGISTLWEIIVGKIDTKQGTYYQSVGFHAISGIIGVLLLV